MKNSFRVAVRVKAMAQLFQFAAQFLMVVDFAIKYNGDVTIFREDGLVAGPEIDNLEPSCPHRAETRLEHALLVRAAVNQGSGGVSNAIGIRCPMFVGETDDSTQVPAPLRFLEFGLQLSPARGGMNSAKPGVCQRFRLKNNPNLSTTNNQKVGANLLAGLELRLFRYANWSARITAGP